MSPAPTEIAGSSLWQFLFLSFAAVLILFEVLRGWRIGLMRQLVRLVAIITGYACAFYCGGFLVPITRAFLKFPDPVLSVLSGAVLAILAYAIINGIGGILFKRTAQQGSGIFRLVWGSAGAFLGLFFGAFFVWLVFAGVRLVGSIAEAQVRSRHVQVGAMMQPVWQQPLKTNSSVVESSTALIATLAKMKTSLETGRAGEAVKEFDPIPTDVYRTLERVGEVASNPASARRFLQFPGAEEISSYPKIVALRNDRTVIALVERGKVLELMQNQRVIDALNDPALRERIKHFDFARALDYSLPKE